MVQQFIFASSIFLIFVVGMYVYSVYRDPKKTENAAIYVYDNIFDIIVILFGISGLIAIAETAIPAGYFAGIFNNTYKLIATAVGGTILGSITTGPPLLAYPIAKAMLDEGIKFGVIGAFISAWSLMDPISLPIEIRYLGKKFAVWRFFMSFVLSAVIGITMALLL